MSENYRGRGRRPAQSDRRPRPERPDRANEPAIDENVSPADLDPDVRRDLRSLDKANAERVAGHLVMVLNLLADDPVAALAHARAARDRAGRVGVVRETAGIAAYTAGEWQEALGELRTARRLTGSAALLPLIADCERGLGRPERAVDIARSAEGRALTGVERTEMLIVESGARLDMNEPQKAVVTLQAADLNPGQSGDGAARLFYAYATALLAAGRRNDAVTWFMNAAAADVDEVTDAELRLVELAEAEGDSVRPTDEVRTAPAVTSSPEAADSAATAMPVESGPASAPSVAEARDGDEAKVVPLASDSPNSATPRNEAESGATPSSTAASKAANTETPPASVAERETLASPSGSAEVVDTPAPAVGTPSTTGTLAQEYDCLLMDLDGTVYAGEKAIPGSVSALSGVTVPILYVTNNASRRAAEVAAHLSELGFAASEQQVVTSAQAGARLLAEHVEPGSRALVVGTDALADEVRSMGIGVTRSADDRPDAVIQGHSTSTDWAALSEAALALAQGAVWIACNVDATLPSERGLLVGNGSMVAALAHATGRTPAVAGKPAAPLMRDAVDRAGAKRPVVVGDRLDTDIAGAVNAGLDSILVLTGVSDGAALLRAGAAERPTYVVADLRGLTHPAAAVRIGPQSGWDIDARLDGGTLSLAVRGDGADASLLPAVAAAAWTAVGDAGELSEVNVTADRRVRTLLAAVGVR